MHRVEALVHSAVDTAATRVNVRRKIPAVPTELAVSVVEVSRETVAVVAATAGIAVTIVAATTGVAVASVVAIAVRAIMESLVD